MKKISAFASALLSLALAIPGAPARAADSGLSIGGCVAIEREWSNVVEVLGGLGDTYTIKDAAAALKRAGTKWADQASLLRYKKAYKMATAVQTASTSALKMRVKLLNGDASGLTALNAALIKAMGRTVVPACERAFNK